MAAEALAAEAVASRLERQEEDIRWLWAEVQRLRDEQLNAPDRGQAEGPCLTREVAQLRAENRDLRHRLYRLRLCLAEELSQQAPLERGAQAAEAQEEAGRAAAGAQVTGRRARCGERGRVPPRAPGGRRRGLRGARVAVVPPEGRVRPRRTAGPAPGGALPCAPAMAWGTSEAPGHPLEPCVSRSRQTDLMVSFLSSSSKLPHIFFSSRNSIFLCL